MLSSNIFLLIIFVLISAYSKRQKSIKEKIIDNAPWRIKLMMWNQMKPEDLATISKSIISRSINLASDTAEVPTSPDLANRRRGSKHSIARENKMETTQKLKKNSAADDDNNLRIKLFRLMYETIRDSDVKVRRAELIRNHYLKVPTFEIGFLIGEVREKYDVMMEFRNTLHKFYEEWKPIDHINAYEQIANYAVQINHLVELIKVIDKNATKTITRYS